MFPITIIHSAIFICPENMFPEAEDLSNQMPIKEKLYFLVHRSTNSQIQKHL